jgi:hypothetical protein
MAHNSGVSAIQHGDYEIFRFQLTKATAERHGPSLPHLVSGHLSTEPLLQDSVSVIFLDRLPTTGKKAKPQRRCVMCSKWHVRKEPIHWCPDCEGDLCLDGCFKSYHMHLHYYFASWSCYTYRIQTKKWNYKSLLIKPLWKNHLFVSCRSKFTSI